MIHLRPDYDGIQPWPTKRVHLAKDPEVGVVLVEATSIDERALAPVIPDDEPVLLIRGQDAAAPATARAWADTAEGLGADADLCQTVRGWAEYIELWQASNRSKVPDADEDVVQQCEIRTRHLTRALP